MEQTCWHVRIAGWTTGRRIVLDGNSVKFEVAGQCTPFCGSCNDRIAWVDRQMRAAGDSVKYHWTSRNLREACFLVLEDCGWKPAEVIPRLSNLLALQISQVG